MESHTRSIAKSITYRVTGTVVTFGAAWLLTRRLDMALQIGLLDTSVKIGVFYVHERIWNRLSFGRPKLPDYEI